MQRVSSAVAASGSCIGSAAKAAKRSGRLRTSAASTSLACLATAIAVVTSWIACTAGAFSDRIIISMPCLSISPRRVSCTSSRRGPRSFHTCAPNNCESASVASMATCSSSAILPCISFLPRFFWHHAMSRRSLSATPRCDEKQKSRPGGRLAEPELAKRAKAGGARRDRTADLVNAIYFEDDFHGFPMLPESYYPIVILPNLLTPDVPRFTRFPPPWSPGGHHALRICHGQKPKSTKKVDQTNRGRGQTARRALRDVGQRNIRFWAQRRPDEHQMFYSSVSPTPWRSLRAEAVHDDRPIWGGD